MIAGIYVKGLLLSIFLCVYSGYGNVQNRPPNSKQNQKAEVRQIGKQKTVG